MGIGASSNLNNIKHDKEIVTFCVICYENDIISQRLGCGHDFCRDCILSIYEYEDCPRCPLFRQYICVEISKTLDNDGFNWLTIGRKTANSLAVAVSCCLICYNILPILQDWDLTKIHGLFK